MLLVGLPLVLSAEVMAPSELGQLILRVVTRTSVTSSKTLCTSLPDAQCLTLNTLILKDVQLGHALTIPWRSLQADL